MPLAYFLAKIIGLFCLILASLLRKKVFAEVVDDIIASRALLYLVGVISLLLGLLVVLTHNFWYGGFLPVVVTLIKVKELSWLFAIIFLVMGAYLTYAGFTG
jgi:hypothetical protein